MKRIKKILLYVVGSFFVLLIVGGYFGIRFFNDMWFKESPNYLSFTSDMNPIQFLWSEGSYGDYKEPHDAMLIPVKIEGVKQKLYVQFDTGAPSTMIYGNTLASLKSFGFRIEEEMIGEDRYVKEVAMELGGSSLNAKRIRIYEGYGQEVEESDTIAEIKIGTIGADFLQSFITEIDFPNQRIRFFEHREDWMIKDGPFIPFGFQGRRLMLPCSINGKEMEMFYDSGSSAFGLITIQNRYQNMIEVDAQEIRYSTNSWGNAMQICHAASSQEMEMGGTSLNVRRVSYVDMYTWAQPLIIPFTRIGGWLGNKPFVEHSLVFDTQMEEFVVVKR